MWIKAIGGKQDRAQVLRRNGSYDYHWRNEVCRFEGPLGQAVKRARAPAASDFGHDARQASFAGSCSGKVLSPARRRACVNHVVAELACRRDGHAGLPANIDPRSRVWGS